ncbi:MAG: threonylcarbamoyl-AMP synthase [Deltaproteobacteria bacterium]|nr:threonylcarbamoyl-AMP synthase [Deltaproteobacteria bacterium]
MIVFPTETFYGLGANALNREAVERVASLKGRDEKNPIALIIADKNMLKEVVNDPPPMAEALMDRFWPGPLTLVLPAKRGLSPLLCNPQGGVGVRVSSHPMASALTRELGAPLTATSANPSGSAPAKNIAQARAYFADRLNIFIDAGELKGQKGSTVIEFIGQQIKIIREGEISSQELDRAIAKK